MRQLTNCPSCGSPVTAPDSQDASLHPTPDEFISLRCSVCGEELQVEEPVPSQVSGGQPSEVEEESYLEESHLEVESDGGPMIVFSVDDDSLPLLDVHQDRDPESELELELEFDNEPADEVIGDELPRDGLSQSDQYDDADVTNPLAFESPVLVSESASNEAASNELAVNEPDWQAFNSAGQRRRRPEASPIRKIVPPILGGLAAFPIATAIMWYGFGRDIGTTGQVVSQYVPWIVPAKLQKRTWDIANTPSPSPRRPKPNSSGSTSNLPKLDKSGTQGESLPSANETSTGKKLDEERASKLESLAPSNRQLRPSTAETKSKSTPASEPKAKAADGEPDKPEPKPAIVPDADSQESISGLVAKMRPIHTSIYGTPKEQRSDMVRDYYTNAKKLSEQAAALKGRSAAIWRKELESLAREILADKSFKAVMQRGPNGELPGVPKANAGEYVVTVMEIGDENKPNLDESWKLSEPWKFGKKGDVVDVPVEMLPSAWRAGSANLPTTCLVFGKLIQSDASPDLVLQVHAAMPLN